MIHSPEAYAKQVSSMRYWLLGRGFHTALRAFEFARSKHDGLRKDGVSPEFSHQMFIAQYARSILPGLLQPEETLAAIFLHDVCEDFDVGYDEIEKLCGRSVRKAVTLLTKKKDGVRIPDGAYYARLSDDPVASVVKGLDRAHNVLTMSDADWTAEKQREYLAQAHDLLLPMLKKARRAFTEQEGVYENVKTLILIQSKHVKLSLDRLEALDPTPQAEPEPAYEPYIPG